MYVKSLTVQYSLQHFLNFFDKAYTEIQSSGRQLSVMSHMELILLPVTPVCSSLNSAVSVYTQKKNLTCNGRP